MKTIPPFSKQTTFASVMASGLLLGACTPLQIPTEKPDPGVETDPGAIDAVVVPEEKEKPELSGTDSDLTPDLLYDLVLASIASQRNQTRVALDALVRAAYRTRDPQITSNAIKQAIRLQDHLLVIELSRLLLSHEPDNISAALALATAQIRNESTDDAAETLLDLVKRQDVGGEAVLREVADLINRQSESVSNQLKVHLLDAMGENTPMVAFTNALVASSNEDWDRFLEYLDLAIADIPDWETAAILKLMSLADNDRDRMQEWSTEFLQIRPDSERFRLRLGHLLVREDQLDEALEQFEIVLVLNPNSADALFAAAIIHMERDEYATAEPLFLRHIAENNRNGDAARIHLAQIFIDQERYEEAYPLLRQVQDSEQYLQAQTMLSEIIAIQSNMEAGLRHLRSIDVMGEEAEVRLILLQDQFLQKFAQLERSLVLLTDALEVRPEHPSLLYTRGLLAARMDRIDIVETDLRLLIRLQPENAHAYNALGYTLADRTDRYEEAMELITHALHLAPEDPYILDSMGWLHYQIGNLDKALEFLEKAWGYDRDAEIAAHLGEVLWVLGREKEAVMIWEHGKEAGPDNDTLLNTIDRFLYNDSDQQSAWWQKPV